MSFDKESNKFKRRKKSIKVENILLSDSPEYSGMECNDASTSSSSNHSLSCRKKRKNDCFGADTISHISDLKPPNVDKKEEASIIITNETTSTSKRKKKSIKTEDILLSDLPVHSGSECNDASSSNSPKHSQNSLSCQKKKKKDCLDVDAIFDISDLKPPNVVKKEALIVINNELTSTHTRKKKSIKTEDILLSDLPVHSGTDSYPISHISDTISHISDLKRPNVNKEKVLNVVKNGLTYTSKRVKHNVPNDSLSADVSMIEYFM